MARVTLAYMKKKRWQKDTRFIEQLQIDTFQVTDLVRNVCGDRHDVMEGGHVISIVFVGSDCLHTGFIHIATDPHYKECGIKSL